MSNNSGPSTCRRSARSKNVFEPFQSFCSGLYGSKNIASSSGHSRCPADSGNLSDNSPNKVKRKKRRKSECDLNLDKRNKTIKKRVIEHNRLKKSYEELIRVKLKDNRIPVVLLNRLDDDRHSQPKLAEKLEERIQLPGLTIPAKVDPKILKYDVVVKINKRHTESLIEVSKRRLQTQSSRSDSDERREGESVGSVVERDFNKCAERLTDKLESYSSDDNKCSKNQLVSNSSRRHARASADKSNNNRLPERLREANSRFSLSSITGKSVGEIQLESSKSSKSSKSFVHNNRRLKRNSIDQINEKNYASLFESKPKRIENVVEESGQKHSEGSSKDVIKYSKNSIKDVQKQNVADISDLKYLEVSININEKLTLPSCHETDEKQIEIASEKNKRVSKNIIDNNTRHNRSFINKNNEKHSADSIEVDCSKTLLEQRNKRLPEKSNKDIENGSKSQTENQKIVTRKVSDKNDSIAQNPTEISISNTEKSIEHNRRFSKRLDKINECLHNETENNRRITRNYDDKNERRNDNLIESSVNFIENFVEEHQKLYEKTDKNVEVNTKKQTDVIKRSTRSMSDMKDKNFENAQENHVDHTKNLKECSKIKSENVDNDIQKCSQNLNEKTKRLSRNSEKSVHLTEENSVNHSKNFEDKVNKISRKSILYCVEEKSDLSKNFDKFKNVSDFNIQSSVKRKNEIFSKNITDKGEQFNDKFTTISIIPIENKKLLRKNLVNTNNEKLAGTSTTNHFDTTQSSVEKQMAKHDINAQSNTVTKNFTEKNKRPRRKLVGKSNDNNTSLSTEDSIEKHNERLTENLNKNINERSKTQIEIIRKRTRLSDKTIDHIENVSQQKFDEQHPNRKSGEKICKKINTNFKQVSEPQTENIKKIRRKTSLDKNEELVETSTSDNLNTTQSNLEKNENEIPEDSSTDITENYLNIEKDNKMVTRNSSYYKQDNNIQISEESTNTVEDFAEKSKAKSSKESDKSFKRKISSENIKLVETNSSSDPNYISSEKILKDNLKFKTNSDEDNKKMLPVKSDTKLKDDLEIHSEHKIITRQSSVEHEKNIQNLIDSNSSSKYDPIQESNKDLPKELVKNFTEDTIIVTENKVVTRKSSLEKTKKHFENMINCNSESLQNSITQEKKELRKIIKTESNIQADNTIVTKSSSLDEYEKRTENVINIKNNHEQSDINISEKKSEESYKHIKDCSKIQSKCKMVTRNSAFYKKYENQANNLIKNKSNYIKNDISKNEENVPEKLQESAIENKAIVKNSSYKLCNNLIKDKSICVQNGIHMDEEKFPEELYRTINECSKHQAEDNEKALRKSSFDKDTENTTEKNSDCIRNTTDRNEEKPAEELDKVIKDCSKSQIENNKRVTRKSSPDKHERHTEDSVTSNSTFNVNYLEKNKQKLVEDQKKYANLIANNIESSQNSDDKDNELLSERLDNKENSKIQIEVNLRITRSTSLKKEISTKNLVENTSDCDQNLIDKNKDKYSENVINNIEIFSKNMSDKKTQEISVNKINDINVENFLENSSVSSQYLVNEISEKESLSSDQSFISHDKEFIENNSNTKYTTEKIITNPVENVIESNFEKTQNISDTSAIKDGDISEENKKNFTINSTMFTKCDKVSENITTNNSQCTENIVIDSSVNEEQFKSSDKNHKTCSEILTKSNESEVTETLKEVKSILNDMNNLTPGNDTNMQISVDAHNETEPNKDIEIRYENSDENNVENASNSTIVKCKHSLEQILEKNFQKISINENGDPLYNHSEETEEKCSEKIPSQVSYENNENELESFSKCSENITLEIDNHSKTFDETKIPKKSNETISKIIKSEANNSNKIVDENLDNTKGQEESIEDITEIRAEDLDESIRNSSKILTANSTMDTSFSFDKNSENFIATNDNNTRSIENLINKVYANDSQISKDSVKISSIENNGLNDNSVKTNEILSENNLENNSKFEGNNLESNSKFEGNNLESNSKYEGNNLESNSKFEGNNLESNSKFEGNNLESNSKLEGNNLESNSKFEGNNLKSNSKLEGKPIEENINIIQNISSKKIIHNSVCKPENTINRSIVKTIVQNTAVNSETCKMIICTDKQKNAIIDKETFARERRKITLMELKKKCSENLDNRQATNFELSRQEAAKTLSTISTNRVNDITFDSRKNSSERTSGNVSESEGSPESLSDIDSNENLADRLFHLNTLGYSNLDSIPSRRYQRQNKKIILKYPQSSFLDQMTDFNCKDCNENFDSNHALERHAKIKHRQRLVIKITKTDENKHVTQMVEPILKRSEEQSHQLNVEDTNESNVPAVIDDEKKTEQTEENQNTQITEGEIKIIVKKESGSRNSHVVKEIKITPKSGDHGNGGGGSSYRMPSCSPVLSEIGQPVKRRPGRPRKYPIFTGNELLEKQLAATTTLDPHVIKNDKVSAPQLPAEESLFEPVESIVLKPDFLFDNHENVTFESTLASKINWRTSENTSFAKMLGIRRKRRRTLSPEYQRERGGNFKFARKRFRHIDYANKEEEETASEPDVCTKYRITKELVVRLTKLDSVPKLNKEFNANLNNVGRDDDDDYAVKVEDRLRRKMKSKPSSAELEVSRHEPVKTVIRFSLENNNNINGIEKCLTVSSSPRRMILQKSHDGGSEASSSHGSTEVGQASGMDDGQEGQRGMKQRSDTNAPEGAMKAQLVVTPRRQAIDRTEADETQKAKLLMLMNATTPYEAASKSNVTIAESPQTFQPQPSTMQLQPQQFCILFIPDALYTSESAMNKDITPTATIVNFQPVPDAEMANRSLIYTPTTPTKISIDEHAKSYVCTTCTEVLDLIGRLEASLGMTEEDKSAIKCPYCSNHFQSLFYLEYHVMQEHLKCENEKQCRHSRFNSLRIPSHEAASEFEIYITFALKCRSCYEIFSTVLQLNDHVMQKHKTLVRLRPSLGPAAIEAVCSAYPAFARKNGVRNNSTPVFQCPSDCVCRIGIRSSDTPLQRQQMLKRCPHVMRRLEKIESAAYEVYTCSLCKSTFLMKDEVVDHLMKMHEVSCKFPCYTCLTSFRSLQMQENHRCSETTLQDVDKILSIAILPTNVGGKDNNKYLEREDSSTDEYGAIKTSVAKDVSVTPLHRNGFKRKNGACAAALDQLLGASIPKIARLTNNGRIGHKRYKRACPKCKKRFAYRKSLHDHIIYEHILKGDGQDGPKKAAIELLKLVNEGKANGERAHELARLLTGHTDNDGIPLKDLTMMDEQENWEEVGTAGNESINEKDLIKCGRCKTHIKLPANSGNFSRLNRQHYLSTSKAKRFGLCESCENSGPKTRRQQLQIIHPFACKKCDETFPTSVQLKCHKRSVHAKTSADSNIFHTCEICKKTFTFSRMLEKHKKIHHENILDGSVKLDEEEDEEDTVANHESTHNCSKETEANHSLDDKANSSARRDSSDSSSAGSKEPEEQPLNCSFCEELCSSKVSLKNHLKREHGRRASICQFCNGLLIDTSEVRHMLDYHIVPSKSNPRHDTEHKTGLGGPWSRDEAGRMRDDVEELVRTLGKHRLQSLMMYHDFEGKCNNAIMRCPICPELFATRESCRFHYVWIHDDNCLLCDETFRSGSSACQHKVNAHTSTASYLWCIQRLVTAIVSTLRLDPNQPSHMLYQILATKLEEQERAAIERESVTPRCPSEKGTSEETATATERFLEEVVLSEDQLPDSSNIIEVVIGKEDSEDDLLSMLNLSPNYESCEQHRLPNAGVAPPEEEEDEETTATATAVPTIQLTTSATTQAMATAVAMTATTTTVPVVENYVTSGVCKYRLENDEEQLVLVVTDEDLITFKDDIGSLAERISTTCDSLTLEEITEMLRAYFENVSASISGSGGV